MLDQNENNQESDVSVRRTAEKDRPEQDYSSHVRVNPL